jgi:glycosyltransferase involved in cell wall biosynthesis
VPTTGRRVLIVTGRLQPTASSRAVVGLACQLKKAGCAVQMVCRSGSVSRVYPPDGRPRRPEEVPPIWLSRALSRNLRGRLSLRELVKRVREIDPDLIHVHGADLAGIAARLVRRVRKPYVLAIDDFLDPGRSISFSRRFVRKVLVSSDAIRVDMVNRIGLSRDLIAVVRDGVVMTDYADREPGLRGFPLPVVGTIGRLVESKGQEYFVRATHLLTMRGRQAHFVMAGEGPDRKRVQNLVAELDLERCVTFARSPVDQLDVLRAIDVLVVPAIREALGLPLIEAMASGIPVIATSAGGVFSLIENGKTGILVPKKDADALARQIEHLLDHPGQAAEMARRGRERVAAAHSIERVAERVLEVYESVLGGEQAKPAAVAGS